MSEIQFFGAVGGSDSKPLPGALAQAWSSICANKESIENNFSNLKIPFIHFMDFDEASEVNSSSFSWPLRVWVSKGDEVYAPSYICKNSADFRKIVLAEEGNDVCFVVTRVPPKWSASYNEKTFFFMSTDGLVIHSPDRSTIHVNGDFRSMFKELFIPENLAVRIISVANNWIIDGFVSRSNPHIKEVFGTSILEASEDALTEFRRGFANGFQSEDSANWWLCDSCAAPISFKSFNIPVSPDNARTSGVLIGALLRQRRDTIFGDLIGSSVEQSIKLLANHSKATIKQFKAFSKVHNALVDGSPEDIQKNLIDYFGEDKPSWHQVSCHFNGIVGHLYESSDYLGSKTWDNYNKKLEVNDNINFTIESDISFGYAQFRIMNEDGTGNYRIRFQSQAKATKYAVLDDGSKIIIKTHNKDKSENDFSLSHRNEALSKLSFDQPSTAGTSAVYAKVELKGDNIVAVENGVHICTLEELTNQVPWL